MSEKLGWAFKWMFLMCSRRSGTRYCLKSLSDHKTIPIQLQVVSVSAAAQLCCLSFLSMLGFAQRAGTEQCPRRRTWESSQGTWEHHMVQTLPGLCKCDWGDHGECSSWVAAQLFIMISITLSISIRIKWIVFCTVAV